MANHAVSFFFVLSGFILQHSYRESINEVGAGRFIAMRAARLYPVHLFVVAALLVLLPFDEIEVKGHLTLEILLATVLLLQAWPPNRNFNFAVNPPAWSISVELFFYACFPWVSRIVARRPVIATLLPLLAVTCFVLLAQPIAQKTHWLSVYMMNPVIRIPEFILGIGLYELRRHILNVNGSSLQWSLIEIAALLSMVLLNASCWPAYHWLGAEIGAPFRDWVMFDVGTTPAFCVVIVVFSLRRGIINKLLELRPLIFLGEISFAIYMLHMPIMQLGSTWGWSKPISLLFTLGAAAIAHLLFEQPCINLVKRLARNQVRQADTSMKCEVMPR